MKLISVSGSQTINMDKNSLLRKIPKVDEILSILELDCCIESISQEMLVSAIRAVLDELRTAILHGALNSPDLLLPERIAADCKARLHFAERRSLIPVINGTGVVLHTNLGRAILSSKAANSALQAGRSYSTLEYSLENGTRGSRHEHVENLLKHITGAEAAMVVNNNAAAVMLILSTMVAQKETIISRGELVEIGGAFRVPDIMVQCGGILKEVGTTNKTRISDYSAAISPVTGALLKVHTSNFKLIGFTESVDITELCALGAANSIPVIHDIGSGLLYDVGIDCLKNEPNVLSSIKAGTDIVSFSGDKLLGGPQAGIIVGKKKYIEACKSNPLARALRVDKLTLAALEETLFAWRDTSIALREIPTLAMLNSNALERHERAVRLKARLSEIHSQVVLKVLSDDCRVGGGSVPGEVQQGYAVSIDIPGISPDKLDDAFRHAPIPIIGHIKDDHYLINCCTVFEADFDIIASELSMAIKEKLQ